MNTDEILNRVDTDEQRWQWIAKNVGLHIPRKAICGHAHHAPFEYIRKSYFEPSTDLVVWGPRGGGKTRLAALATVLDLLHKPGSSIRILGGSQAQSLRMWDYLVPDLEKLLEGTSVKFTARSGWVRLSNGSFAAAIPQSQRAVRGLRIQKLRCDEVELFDPKIYAAAQLTTRSMADTTGKPVRGTIESLSTLHQPWGLMNRVIEQAALAGRPVIKWCILDVLQKCPPTRECKTCPLEEDCGGVARNADGFYDIDDAINAKLRSGKEAWEAEMLCRRPSMRDAVFPTFEPSLHVRKVPAVGEVQLAMDFGFANPFVCLWIVDDGVQVHVLDEYVQSATTLEKNLALIKDRHGRAKVVSCDPAGYAHNEHTGHSNIDILKKDHYRVLARGSQIMEGLELIRTALMTAAGQTTLSIHPRCERLMRAMSGYHYDPRRGDEKPVKDGEHDHLIDALRYFYVNRHLRKASRAYGGKQY